MPEVFFPWFATSAIILLKTPLGTRFISILRFVSFTVLFFFFPYFKVNLTCDFIFWTLSFFYKIFHRENNFLHFITLRFQCPELIILLRLLRTFKGQLISKGLFGRIWRHFEINWPLKRDVIAIKSQRVPLHLVHVFSNVTPGNILKTTKITSDP